jgi:hypothetical protein
VPLVISVSSIAETSMMATTAIGWRDGGLGNRGKARERAWREPTACSGSSSSATTWSTRRPHHW